MCDQIFKSDEPQNQIPQFEYNIASFFEKVFKDIESISVDELNAVLYPSIVVQRMMYKWQERFCDGLWVSALENKMFLRILNRLTELVAGI